MKWQPIETAPKDGTTFITYSPDTDWQEGLDLAGWDKDSECWWKGGCGFDYATHWMPLPEPPT